MASEQVWVVAACFNEAEVISVFLERVMALPEVNHLLLIDDGSSDATVAVIRAWQKSHADQAVTLLELTRNFGKEAAMLAGLDYANGRCAAAVLIDSDLQHPPERIPAMVQAWRNGAEVVTAVRDDRDAEGLVKVATASWFYRVFNRLVDSIQLQEGAGDFRLLSAPVVEAVTQLREATRFSKGLMPWTGRYSDADIYDATKQTSTPRAQMRMADGLYLGAHRAYMVTPTAAGLAAPSLSAIVTKSCDPSSMVT